jgi:hypothetical protein
MRQSKLIGKEEEAVACVVDVWFDCEADVVTAM